MHNLSSTQGEPECLWFCGISHYHKHLPHLTKGKAPLITSGDRQGQGIIGMSSSHLIPLRCSACKKSHGGARQATDHVHVHVYMYVCICVYIHVYTCNYTHLYVAIEAIGTCISFLCSVVLYACRFSCT